MCNYTGDQSEGVDKLDVIFSNCVVEFLLENNRTAEYCQD